MFYIEILNYKPCQSVSIKELNEYHTLNIFLNKIKYKSFLSQKLVYNCSTKQYCLQIVSVLN